MSLYDIFIIGEGPGNAASKLTKELRARLRDLGVDPRRHARFLKTKNIAKHDPLLPNVAACLLPLSGSDDMAAVTKLVHLGVPIIPIVDDVKNFGKQAPPILKKFNGIGIGHDGKGLTAAAAAMLEWVGLLRQQRRIFISYRRQDSRAAALQLHDRVNAGAKLHQLAGVKMHHRQALPHHG